MSSLTAARRVADAVLFEGYLLYPYTAGATKNRLRWQFGVLGPPGADRRGDGEPPRLAADCLLRPGTGATLQVLLRGLQLVTRTVEVPEGGGWRSVPELRAGGRTWTSFEEGAEVEVPAILRVEDLAEGVVVPVPVPGGLDCEELSDAGRPVGRVVRTREPVTAELRLRTAPVDGVLRLSVEVENTTPDVPPGREAAAARSLLGAHVLLAADGARFVSLLEPPPELAAAAAGCDRDRCFPVLAGPPGTDDVLLVSPIILYDHPALAPESAVPLFDATEIDEILTLRVLTLTDEEKAAARATDPRAAAVIDRCEALTPEEMARLHGVLRDPAAPLFAGPDPPEADTPESWVPEPWTPDTEGRPWWDPAVDGAVDPDRASVLVRGVPVQRGSTVRLHPSRRADAQDLFYDGREARVAAVLADVDGGTHVAVVLTDDPAADLHEWYGRHLHFGPEELEPVPPAAAAGEEEGCAPSE